MLLMAGAATFLMLRPATIFWSLLPKLRFVQFPWRWMSIVGVVFAFFLAAAVARSRFRWIWIVGVALVLVGGATFFVHSTWWDTDDVTTLQAGVVAGSGFDGVDEYDPKGDDHYNLPAKAPQAQVLAADSDAGPGAEPDAGPIAKSATPAAGATILVERWKAAEKRLRVTAVAPVRVALRVLNYPAWRVEVNGTRVTPENNGDTAQMVVPVAAGSSEISVVFGRTWDRTVGGVVSILSILFAAALFPARRKN
jgi:NADH:ubiquinone oxidoreductase subunit K